MTAAVIPQRRRSLPSIGVLAVTDALCTAFIDGRDAGESTHSSATSASVSKPVPSSSKSVGYATAGDDASEADEGEFVVTDPDGRSTVAFPSEPITSSNAFMLEDGTQGSALCQSFAIDIGERIRDESSELSEAAP